jgi:hypothetical protein
VTSDPVDQSDSKPQRDAEVIILAALGRLLGLVFVKAPRILVGPGTAWVEIDGATADLSVLVEVYARQGTLKGGQPKKIAQDILKLALVKRNVKYGNARTIVAFASRAAHDSIRGWLREAAAEFGVELVLVDVADSPDLVAGLIAAQDRQKMVNQTGS